MNLWNHLSIYPKDLVLLGAWTLIYTLKGWRTALYSTDTIAVYSECELRFWCLGKAIGRNCVQVWGQVLEWEGQHVVCQHWPLDLWRKQCYRRRPKLFPRWSLRHRDIPVWYQIRKVTVSIWESNTAWLETLWGWQEMQHYSGSSRFCNFDMWGHTLGKTRVTPHPPGTFWSRGNQSDRNRGEECEKTGFWETLWSLWELTRWNIKEDEAGPFLLQQ